MVPYCRDELTGEDCIEQFLLQMDYYNEEIREMFKKTVPMTELNDEQLKNYNEATNCYCCTKSFNMNNANLCKVKDHCHITGQYRGAACSHCNLNNLNIIAKTHTIPVVFHNLKGYDMHHILRNLDNPPLFAVIKFYTRTHFFKANFTR